MAIVSSLGPDVCAVTNTLAFCGSDCLHECDSLDVITGDALLTGPSAREQLLRHPLFRGIRAENVEPLLRHVLIRKIPRAALLHAPGENSPLYLVLSGALRAYQLTADGRRLMLEILGPGSFDGILPMVGRRGHFTEASAASVVACLEWKLVEEFSARDRRFARNLVELVASRLEQREEHLEWMLIRDPTRRLARQLMALGIALGEPAGQHGKALPRPITHQLLADMLGVRRETVTIHLQHLTKLGAVDGHRRPLVVYPQKLQAIARAETS